MKSIPFLDRFDGITMVALSTPSADRPSRGQAHKVRQGTRAKPRLEVLEARCLLSGWRPRIGLYDEPANPLRAAPSGTERIAAHASDSKATIQSAERVGSASVPPSLIADDDSGYEAAGSVRISPASVGFPGLAGGSYTVVFETNARHDTLASAQVLPDLSFFGVVGTISTGDTVDFYRLTLNEKADELDFGLVFQKNGSVAPMEFQIFDGAGQLLGEWTSGGQEASILLAQLGPQAAGSTLYLGISAGNSGGPTASSASISYQLWVGRQSATDQTAGSPQGSSTAPTATLAPLAASALSPVGALGTAPGRESPGASGAGPTDSPGGIAVAMAVGPPAIRSGRPSVEALSSGDSDRLTEREIDAVLHQDASEQNLVSSPIEQRKVSDPGSDPEAESDSGALVAMNGPGGFALLGGVAIGHRRRTRAAAAADPGLVAAPPRAEPVPIVAAEPIAPGANIVVTHEQPLVDGRSIRRWLWGGLPSSLFSGLGLAMVFTLHAALSQPFAGFDYLARCFESSRRKLSPSARKAVR